jgi:hypothetical protein
MKDIMDDQFNVLFANSFYVLKERHQLRLSELGLLRILFGPEVEEVTGNYRKSILLGIYTL